MADQQPASGNSSDREGETFEDAPDMSSRPSSQSERRSRSRSLIRRNSTTSTLKEGRTESPAPDTVPEESEPSKDSSEAPEKEKTADKADNEPAKAATNENATPGKSPLLTSHRISVTEDMDDVNLDEEGAAKSYNPLPKLPSHEPHKSESSLQGLSGKTSPVKLQPPSATPVAAAPEKHTSLPPIEKPTRKLTSPFAWLSRNTSERKTASPPSPANDRRNTTTSLATISSNPELTLSKIEDESAPNNRSSQSSLRDRFKFLRMKEEAGITMGDDTNEPEAAAAPLTSPKLGEETKSVPETASNPSSPGPGSLTRQPTINPKLAPGTASGMALGPAGDSAEPVDWDLWQSVVYEGPAAVARTSSEELNKAIASGIPQAIRGVVWQVLAQSKNEDLESVYKELVVKGTDKEHMSVKAPRSSKTESSGQVNGSGKEKDSIASSASSVHSDNSTPPTSNGSTTAPLASPSLPTDNPEDLAKAQAKLAHKAKEDNAALQKLEKTIKRDLGARTSYSKYVMAAGLQDGLFGICKAYALYDESVGYAQGMNFIAMPLLFNMPEEEAFCLFVKLMNKYGLRDLFIQDMPGLHLHLYQFERLLEDLEPALYCHLHRREVKPQLYATQWFLTLFAYRFPLQLVLRIYDLILSEGLEGAILKFGIVLMQKNADALLGMKDMATLTTFLKEKLFDVYIDKSPSQSSILESGFFGSAGGVDKEVYRADMLVRDAVAVKVTPEMLTQYTAEWKEQQRIEKEREQELEGLRSKTSALENKVRQLENRAEQHDTEHVQVASELIKTKVENENLSDHNEMLKTKVEELQRIVETQPEEVEQRLKHEMETVMQKNIVVHNENRALEEQMAEMEKELVETKMQWAELNNEHDTLKQKWNNVQQLMSKR